jgi:hypothetical protein
MRCRAPLTMNILGDPPRRDREGHDVSLVFAGHDGRLAAVRAVIIRVSAVQIRPPLPIKSGTSCISFAEFHVAACRKRSYCVSNTCNNARQIPAT